MNLVVKKARACQTKSTWALLFQEYESEIRRLDARSLSDIFELLVKDKQSLQYDEKIWTVLLETCLSTWNLDLGLTIARYVANLPCVEIAVLSAKILAEKGEPILSRTTAQRALRLKHVSALEALQLEFLICQSYVDEGKRNMAIKYSNRIQQTLKKMKFTDVDKAQFLGQLARIDFFLGRYAFAAAIFYDSYLVFSKLENWYEAARSVYNAGSCYFSAGGKLQSAAFPLIEECRKISESHGLWGPLSHVEAFYGHDDYWHGDFAGARDHYRRAHRYIPASDKSFRTLHVLSMLSLIYLRTGQFGLAKKFGEKTLRLAEVDHSQRFKIRYDNLRAELMWENGEVEDSQNFLQELIEKISKNGVNTLEELSTLARFYFQSGKLGQETAFQNLPIAEQLKKNTGDWVEYLHARAKLMLGMSRFDEATANYQDCLTKAKNYGDKYHTCLALLGLTQTAIARSGDLTHIEDLAKELEIAVARLVETPIIPHVHMVRAGIAYRKGDWPNVSLHLQRAVAHPRITFCDRFVCEAWLATMRGEATRVYAPWQNALIATLTKWYFAPSLTAVSPFFYQVSGHYSVDLTQNPALNELLRFLMQRNRLAATPAEIQEQVWRQSLNQQGWPQKIRNSLARLRDLIPYTVAPLLVHFDETVALNCAAISITPIARHDVNPRDEILRLLSEGPMSSNNLAGRLDVSPATTKRILKVLSDKNLITVMKLGRQVVYQAISDTAN